MILAAGAPTDLERFAALLWRPGDVREVRIPGPGRTDAGYFDSPDALVRAVEAVDGRQNVYVTVNPVDPALLARAANRIKARVRTTTSDANITERRWLPIDIDPQRPSDISASEAEREAALEVTRRVWAYLHGLGWQEPVTALSGNGYWLLYPVDLPNDPESKRLIDGVLAHLAARFSTDQVSIDTTVSNAARIVALIGTLKVKGDATPTRPHRRSGLLRVPADLAPVPAARLAELASPPPLAATAGSIVVTGDGMPAGWVGALLDGAGIAYRLSSRNGSTWYRLAACPFHPDDDQGGDCGVGEDGAGKGLGHCFHNRGAGKGWQDFKTELGLATTSPGASAPARELRRTPGPGIDAADLLALDIQPLRWIVPDLIPEGTTILAAPPKVGKSCLVYQIAVEAAIGGELLGRRVTPGSVLYLALEDGKRRGRDRLLVALAGRTMPHGRLEVRWDANRIGAGLEDDIRAWLDEHPDAAMVAVDTLGKVRPRSTGRQGAYEVDVQDLAALQDLFRDRPVALVIVHHARKEASDDFLASVSGTYGITGSADTIVAIRRKRLERFGTVMTTGRDIADAEVPVQFADGRWLPAPGALPEASVERAEVYEVIERRGPIFPQAIADALGLTRQSVQNMVAKLVGAGAVARVPKGYVVAGVGIEESHQPPIGLNTPDVSDDSPRHQRHQGEVSRTPAREAGPALRVVPADPTGWANPCHWYRDHQSQHRQTPSGWTCDACHPEEGRPA